MLRGEADMTQIDDEPVTRSLELLAERVGDPAALVYRRLFEAYPETEALFVRDTTGAVRGEMLAMAFQCLLDLDGGYEANLIRAERVNHEGFGVAPAAFADFFPVLMDTVRDVLGDDWTREIEAAWTERIARIRQLTA
jgi:hemoglobin-like flavoprotein